MLKAVGRMVRRKTGLLPDLGKSRGDHIVCEWLWRRCIVSYELHPVTFPDYIILWRVVVADTCEVIQQFVGNRDVTVGIGLGLLRLDEHLLPVQEDVADLKVLQFLFGSNAKVIDELSSKIRQRVGV